MSEQLAQSRFECQQLRATLHHQSHLSSINSLGLATDDALCNIGSARPEAWVKQASLTEAKHRDHRYAKFLNASDDVVDVSYAELQHKAQQIFADQPGTRRPSLEET